jgi:hypothetical protein
MTLFVRPEQAGSKLNRLLIFHDGKYIGEYERSQDADIERKRAEINDAESILLEVFNRHGEFCVRWDSKERKKSVRRVDGVEVTVIPKSLWKRPSWQSNATRKPAIRPDALMSNVARPTNNKTNEFSTPSKTNDRSKKEDLPSPIQNEFNELKTIIHLAAHPHEGGSVTMLKELFDNSCAAIEREYQRLEHCKGWRFITGPKATLARNTRILFISLNPGGDYDPPDHPHESSENGSSYLIESWKGKPKGKESLQVQFQRMASKLQQIYRHQGSVEDFIDTQILTAHFIPFRSSRFNTLHRSAESIIFGRTLWDRILKHLSPDLIITLNPETFQHISEILENNGCILEEHKSFQTGWGTGTSRPIGCEVSKYKRMANIVSILRLPHLSTFKLFSKPECKPYLDEIFNFACIEPSEKAV